MRGVVVVIVGLLTLAAAMLVAGVLLEPIADVVTASAAVQALGWGNYATEIRDTILRWIPALSVIYLLTWAAMWALRRGRVTGVERR